MKPNFDTDYLLGMFWQMVGAVRTYPHIELDKDAILEIERRIKENK